MGTRAAQFGAWLLKRAKQKNITGHNASYHQKQLSENEETKLLLVLGWIMKSSRHMAQVSDQQHTIYLGVDQQLCKIISLFTQQVKKHLVKGRIRPLPVPQRKEMCFSLSALFVILKNQQSKKALAYERRLKCVSKPLLPALPPTKSQPFNIAVSCYVCKPHW